MNLESNVDVPLWVVLYAIRYGMGRQTYANSDASMLAARFWNTFDEGIRNQIMADARLITTRTEKEAWEWMEA